LHLKHHPDHPHDDELLYACTHWTGYDAQVDGYPTSYLWTALRLGGACDRLRDRILAAFRADSDRDVLSQLLDLVDQYARNGDGDAQQAMLDRMEASGPDEFEHYPATIINRLGERGLILVALQIGKRLDLGTYNDWIDLSSSSPQWLDPNRAMAVVKGQVGAGPGVDRLLTMLEEYAGTRAQSKSEPQRSSWSRTAILQLPFIKYRDWVRSESGRPMVYLSRKWGEKAPESELRAAAEIFLKAEDEFDRKLGLFVFANAPFPFDPQPLIDLTNDEDEFIAFHALRSLRHARHPKVRAFFEKSLAAKAHLKDLFGLLLGNLLPGDVERVTKWIRDQQDDYPVGPAQHDAEITHGIAFDLLEVIEYHDIEAVEIVKWVFENTPCRNCRRRALEHLIKHELANNEILVDCRWDQCPYIRRAARKAMGDST